ncbi:hypothetical protein ABI_11240 [Asticcacaulis biprosthecium C19]|uniref:Lipoprotein n=1 Tax=Asticcacaulis biprosthecium C19 TaxID=715226 RepID=F4QHF0_9CAUL|nr:hypothetical protein ABI_11240 [Asticcacaulis biprosthecium C19]
MFRTFASALLIVGSVSNTATAGAFGIEMGTPLVDLKVVGVFDDLSPVKSYDIRVPAPNPDFGIYTVDLSPRTGVCRIYAVSRNYPNDQSGAQIKAVYSRVKADLVRKYGQPAQQNQRPATRNFATSLHTDESNLTSGWIPNGGKADDVRAIHLMATAPDSSTTALMIAYAFTNDDACADLEAEAEGAGL